ncbi:thioredoxin family protein [Pedobacter sp. KLB.chiD]|uniref:thioredoxin family protein n=1 Tax=Pedobacter sp. KLB.chiD TaxID=3387402 RepID=UPI003999B2C1
MRRINIAVAMLFLSLAVSAQKKEIHFEKLNLKEALAKAKSENKSVFVDCFTSWCIPCKQMEANVFTQDSVADFYNENFINIKVDMEKGEGPAVKNRYSIEAFPSYLVLDADGKIRNKFVGGMPAKEFIAHARKGLTANNDEANLNARYEHGDRTPELMRAYIKQKLKVMEKSRAKELNNELMTILTPQQKASPENWFLFGQNRYTMYLSDFSSPNFEYLAEHWRDFVAKNTKDTVDKKLSSGYRQIASWTLNGFYAKVKPFNKNDYERYKTQIRNTEMPDKKQLLVMMDIAIAAGEKNIDEVTNLFLKHLGSFSEENRHILFDYVTFARSIKGYTFPKIAELSDEITKTSGNPYLVSLFKSMKERYVQKAN